MVIVGNDAESRIESLAREMAALRRRVEVLESSCDRSLPVTDEASPESGAVASAEKWGSADIVGLAGRTLVILGGAFLLRAVSAAALLPAWSGPAFGLLYAVWWLRQADLASTPDQRMSAFFYGLSAVGIAYPLIWETAARFRLLPGAVAAPAVVAFLGLGLAVAWRRSLRQFAWVATAAALLTTLELVFTTREFVLYAGVLIAISVTVEAYAFHGGWAELRWAPAALLDLLLVLLAILISQPRMSPALAAALPPGAVIVVSLAAPVVYLTSVGAATLGYRRPISVFEIAQVAASLVCGIGTALTVIAFHGGNPDGISISISVLGLACYAIAFRSLDAESHPRQNLYAYTSFAGVLVAAGSAMLLDGASLGLSWFALSWVGVALGVRYRSNTLRLHGALYMAAAAFPSGLAAPAFIGLLGPLENLRSEFPILFLIVIVGLVTGYGALAVARGTGDVPWYEHLPRFVVAAMLVWVASGLSAPRLTALLLTVNPGLDRMAFLASTRTCVLSLMAAGLAWSGRRWNLDDLAWLVYPLMVLTGARLAWEDLSYGGPVNMFLALGFYGGALIVASRSLRKD